MNKALLEEKLAELPLYAYFYVDPQSLEFSERIRWICQTECPMYGKSWACPPGVGTVEQCKAKCLQYRNCLMVGTITEPEEQYSMEAALATRPEHEALTGEIRELFREQGVEPYILSTEACAHCEHCTYPEGKPCRFPGRMHPCVESHGINVIPTLEENGLEFQYGDNLITWYSLLFFND